MNTPTNPKLGASRARRYGLDLSRYYKIPAVQSTLSVVLSLFVVAIFILFAIKPTFVTIVKLQKSIEDSAKTLQTLTTKVAALERASTNLESLKPFLPMIEASIPSKEAGYATLTSSVELIAYQSGVALTTTTLGETLLYSRIFTPFTPSKGESVIALPFTARVVGSYGAISQFLQSLMKMDRIVHIESLTYAREGNVRSTTESATSLTISGEAYYLADQAQLLKTLSVTKKGGK